MRFNRRQEAQLYIKGCIQWMQDQVSEGWDPYYVNFMFQPLPGSLPTIIAQMHSGIQAGFYSRFWSEFTRNSRSPSQQHRLPKLWLFPDRPGPKKQKKLSAEFFRGNDGGLHFNGPLLIPPKSRFQGCPIQHIEANQSKYLRHGLCRIDLEPVYNIAGMVDYAAKTVKWGRANIEDCLYLPAPLSELPAKIRAPWGDREAEGLEADREWLRVNYTGSDPRRVGA